MESIAVAVIAVVPPTIAALAAWRKMSGVHDSLGGLNGRGDVHGQLARLEDKIDDVRAWQAAHLDRWHTR